MKLPIAKEGIPYILIFTILTLITYLLHPYIAIIPFILTLFTTFFFRDPYREIPFDENLLVSPADGKIMSIVEIDENDYIKDKAIKVSIFLSIFNVHINRIPIGGKIDFHKYRPGKMLPAFKSHASELNERNSIGINTGTIKILIHQITGFIARRIVWWVKPGDIVKQGDRFGLIKFGSCTEIIVPKDKVEILVQQGDKVIGGKTVIGRVISK
ncbi:phosphatidylserine decarboxylase [Anoxybacter fermentans]|uniref:Phosphatidylserine decarboxylase proenzyme n=1 Tax=Anoxybacter fermentans TaxID=1323375 RepID=A0A3Q9HPC2_9FIRM|nr:phosphatidylserine decarboxylase family protein [Anoxybacter fermentans]AZR72646.1 phosphatidylserine decarboxylase [Anoxybacter fermentans]